MTQTTEPDHAASGRHPLAVLNWPLIVVFRLYQLTLSPFIGGQCRFRPTCSQYAIEACRIHHPVRAVWLTVWRILRCHPFCRGGHDPVPGWGVQPRGKTTAEPSSATPVIKTDAKN